MQAACCLLGLAACCSAPGPLSDLRLASRSGSLWIDGPGARIHVWAWGSLGQGPALVAVHGWGGSGFDFASLAEELSGEAYLLAPDLPGSGLSEPVPRERYGLELFVASLERLVEQAGGTPIVLVGHSLGAKVACTYAARHPEAVRGLVLLAPYGLEGQEGALVRGLAARPLLVRLAARLNNCAAIKATLRRRVFYDPRAVPVELARRQCESQLSAHGREALAAVTSALIGCQPIDPVLPQVSAPTLIVWGREDRVLSAGSLARFAALLPRASTLLLDRCGHMPMVERRAETAAAIREFLGRL